MVINKIPRENELIEFHLVTRQKHSTLLHDETTREKESDSHLYVPGTVPLSRIVLVYDISPIIQREEQKLKEALELAIEFKRSLLASILEQGLSELAERQKNFNELFSKVTSGKNIYPNVEPLTIEDDEYIYVYQVSWGDNIYLLPLDFKCFVDDYGQCEYLPPKIKAPVIEIHNYRLTPGNRKRYKFLSHLPLQSVFSFVEVDLKGLVSANTLRFHRSEFKEREKHRLMQKQKEEELEKLKPQK